jgi:hypothetical protein
MICYSAERTRGGLGLDRSQRPWCIRASDDGAIPARLRWGQRVVASIIDHPPKRDLKASKLPHRERMPQVGTRQYVC